MTCLIDHCSAASGCVHHVRLALQGSDADDAAAALARLDALADDLRPLRSRSPRSELRACAALLAGRCAVDAAGDPEAADIASVLERGVGAPLALGAIAVTAARKGGIALGLLAGPAGAVVVAHATLASPTVLDCADGFALRDLTGHEPSYRWLCAHQTAMRLQAQLAAAGRQPALA